jgi:Fe-S cluster assembly iron-binding protein IscA
VALLRGPALEPGPPRPPLIVPRGTRSDRRLAMPSEQARPQGRPRVTPQDLVLLAAFRGDPVDVVLGVFGWGTRRSRGRTVAEVRIVRTRAPSFRAHGTTLHTPRWWKARRGVPSVCVGKEPDRDREGVSVMLQITDTAASAFRDILAREEVRAQAIRLVPGTRTNGRSGISLEAINEPAPADAEARAQGVRVVVAEELASTLDDAVLDAKPTEQGTEFFIRSQPA